MDKQITLHEIGASWFLMTQRNNEIGKTLSDSRGSITQEQAQFFFGIPSPEAIEAVASGYAAAAESAGKKSGKVGAAQIRTLGKQINQTTDGNHYGLLTFKTDEESGDVVGFGNGSISKEYNAILIKSKSAIERYVLVLQQIDGLKQDYDNALAELTTQAETWKAQAKAAL